MGRHSIKMQKKLQVFLIGNYSGDRQASMQKFADLLFRSLQERGIPVELLRPQPLFSRLAPHSKGLAKWLGYVDKFIVFPWRLRQTLRAIPIEHRRHTVVHICDHSNSPYVGHLGGLSHVVTCHDLIAIQQAAGKLPSPPVSWTGRRLQRWILKWLGRARWIACDSDNTRKDLLTLTERPARFTATIHCQLNHPYAAIARTQAWTILGGLLPQDTGSLVLHVGNNSWYKNREGVLRIFAGARELAPEKRPRLVIIGREFTPEQNQLIARLGLGGFVHLMTDASTEQLEAAYSVADAFLFPSLYEGFGWPPVEAQACGCPVIAGTGGSLAEVLGDSALTADATDETRLAVHLAKVLQDPELRADLREKGLRNVARFQAPRMIDDYVALYERILGDKAKPGEA